MSVLERTGNADQRERVKTLELTDGGEVTVSDESRLSTVATRTSGGSVMRATQPPHTRSLTD